MKRNNIFRTIIKRGYNDRLYLLNFLSVWVFTYLCFLLTALSSALQITDFTIINVGVPSAFAELSIHTGFIVWKAKAENCRKHKDVNLFPDME